MLVKFGAEGREIFGFLALKVLQSEFDGDTKLSMLRGFLDLVNPKPIKKAEDTESSIKAWEREMFQIKSISMCCR